MRQTTGGRDEQQRFCWEIVTDITFHFETVEQAKAFMESLVKVP